MPPRCQGLVRSALPPTSVLSRAIGRAVLRVRWSLRLQLSAPGEDRSALPLDTWKSVQVLTFVHYEWSSSEIGRSIARMEIESCQVCGGDGRVGNAFGGETARCPACRGTGRR